MRKYAPEFNNLQRVEESSDAIYRLLDSDIIDMISVGINS